MGRPVFWLLNFIWFLLLDWLFFGFTAKIKGKHFNHDCSVCDNWACTYGTIYQDKPCFPVRDWSRWCLK